MLFLSCSGPSDAKACPTGRNSRQGIRSMRVGFTLVELVVVMAIITILAALLLPTLRHAVRQGRTVSCINQLKQNSLALTTYASNNRRYYPRISEAQEGCVGRSTVKSLSGDMRPMVKLVFEDMDQALSCPLNAPTAPIAKGTSDFLYGSYEWYAGTYLDLADKSSGLFRVGQTAAYKNKKFSVLMGDFLRTRNSVNSGNLITSHNAEGLTHNLVNSSKYSMARWIGPSAEGLDRNFALMDGSCKRYRDIVILGYHKHIHPGFRWVGYNPNKTRAEVKVYRSWAPFND